MNINSSYFFYIYFLEVSKVLKKDKNLQKIYKFIGVSNERS